MSLPRIVAGPRRRWLVRLLLNGLGQAGAAFLMAGLMRQLMAQPSTGADELPWPALSALILIGLLVLALRVLERIDAERLGQDYVMKVRLALFRHLSRLPQRGDRNPRLGVTMTRLISDLNSLRNWVSIGIARSMVAAVSLCGALAALAWLHPGFALVGLLLVALCLGVAWLLTACLRQRIAAARRHRGRLAANLGEKIPALATVVQFGNSRREWRRLRRQSRRLREALVQRMRVAGVLRTTAEAGLAPATAALVVMNVIARPAPEELIAALLLLGMAAAALADLCRAWDYRLSYEEGHKRLQQLLSLPRIRQAETGSAPSLSKTPTLRLHQLRIADLFTDLSAEVGSGERVLLTGAAGSGKSTLLALIAGRFDPDRGQVLLSRQPLRAIAPSELYRKVQLVAPQVPLLRGTVADNIGYGLPRAAADTAARIADWARLCGLDQPETGLDLGLHSRVAEHGTNLSAGLRARISLARAMAVQPQWLLIDDPVLLSDPKARKALQNVLAIADAGVIIASTAADDGIAVHRVWQLVDGHLRTVRSGSAVPLRKVG